MRMVSSVAKGHLRKVEIFSAKLKEDQCAN